VRLSLEATTASYIDGARGNEDPGQDTPAMLRRLRDETLMHAPFARSLLKNGRVAVEKTASIFRCYSELDIR
jgi:hypothetical protein